MMGIPFYGYDNGSAIIGSQYLDLLKTHERRKSMSPCPFSNLFFLRYRDDRGALHSVFFPSLLFLQERLELAQKLHCGVSIWELGQGLDFFLDLLCRVCYKQNEINGTI